MENQIKDLYEHRNLLFLSLVSMMPRRMKWIATHDSDGKKDPDYFLVGLELPQGQITYHMGNYLWDLATRDNIPVYEKAPRFDGHTSEDVAERLKKFIESNTI